MIQADYEAQFFHKMAEQEHLEAESDCIEDEPVLEQELTEFAEAIYNFTKIGAMDISNIKETTRSFLLANYLVQKDPDQSLPKIAKVYDDWGGESGLAGYRLAQQDMLEAGWAKVKKE